MNPNPKQHTQRVKIEPLSLNPKTLTVFAKHPHFLAQSHKHTHLNYSSSTEPQNPQPQP